jgi:hypothetical protein
VWNETNWVRVKISPQKGFWNLASKLEWGKTRILKNKSKNHHLVWRVMTSSMKLKSCNKWAYDSERWWRILQRISPYAIVVVCTIMLQNKHSTTPLQFDKVSELVRHNFQFLPPCTYLGNCDYPREGTQHHNHAPRNTKKFGYRRKYIHQESRQFKLEDEELGVWIASWCT